jgi:hypothetical protein
MSRRCSLLISISLLLISSAAAVGAQERGGAVTGVVTDAGHYILPGARIELVPSGPSAVSDQEGQFTITNVKPGEYTVRVSSARSARAR